MRIRITKQTTKYKRGEVVDVSKNEAFGLIDSGHGIISKDINETETTVKKRKK